MSAKAKASLPRLELGLVNASPVVTAAHTQLRLVLVGCGGTGSFMARSVAQVARVLEETGKTVRVTFVDPDRVEDKNVPRQNFCPAEIGLNKAEALAERYSAAWALEIEAVPNRFRAELVPIRHNEVIVLIGCVDTASGRQAMHGTLKANTKLTAPRIWHLDCGNSEHYGQVRIGAATTVDELKTAFATPGMCMNLPAPGLQASDLLRPPLDEVAPEKLSCAELLRANAQSLTINQRMAAECADFLVRLVVTQNLKRYATFVAAEPGSSSSLYTTPSSVAACLNVAERKVTGTPNRHKAYRSV